VDYEVVLQSGKIVVDDWEAVKHRKTPVLARMHDQGLLADDDIYAILHEIVSGKKVGRETYEERIFFAENGMAYEDIAIASKVHDLAIARGIGQRIRLWNRPLWV
jgi:ornithine cyclodeaminase/alanine dehydrogenase-like protein (mu-crystallin family)